MRDTAHSDANTDVNANVYSDNDSNIHSADYDYANFDARVILSSRLPADHREVRERLPMRLLSFAILLVVALLVIEAPLPVFADDQ